MNYRYGLAKKEKRLDYQGGDSPLFNSLYRLDFSRGFMG